MRSEARVFVSPPGGVMTIEVGAITGDLEAWIDHGIVRIRYAGALDNYTVGSAETRSIEQVVYELSTDPGIGPDGNALVASLRPHRRA